MILIRMRPRLHNAMRKLKKAELKHTIPGTISLSNTLVAAAIPMLLFIRPILITHHIVLQQVLPTLILRAQAEHPM